MNVIESLLTKQTSALLSPQPEKQQQPEMTTTSTVSTVPKVCPSTTSAAPLNENRQHNVEFNSGSNSLAAYCAPAVYGSKQMLLATENRQFYSRSCGTTTNTTARIPTNSHVTMSPMSSTSLSPLTSLKMHLTIASLSEGNVACSALTVDRYQQDENRENIPVHIIYLNNTGAGAAVAANDERRRETGHEVTTTGVDEAGQPLMIVEGGQATDAMALTYMFLEDAEDRDDTENYSHYN